MLANKMLHVPGLIIPPNSFIAALKMPVLMFISLSERLHLLAL